MATDRLTITPQGNVRYTLKTPYRDGTTHILLEPLDFIARLADPAIVKRILDHLQQRSESAPTVTPPARAPPCAAQRQGTTH